jgi:hypothetical protein
LSVNADKQIGASSSACCPIICGILGVDHVHMLPFLGFNTIEHYVLQEFCLRGMHQDWGQGVSPYWGHKCFWFNSRLAPMALRSSDSGLTQSVYHDEPFLVARFTAMEYDSDHHFFRGAFQLMKCHQVAQ